MKQHRTTLQQTARNEKDRQKHAPQSRSSISYSKIDDIHKYIQGIYKGPVNRQIPSDINALNVSDYRGEDAALYLTIGDAYADGYHLCGERCRNAKIIVNN